LPRYVAILCRPCILLGRVSHRRFKKCFIISPRFDEFLVKLLEVIFLLSVLPDEFDQLWPNSKGTVIQFRDLLVVSNIQVATASAEQRQQLFHILDLTEYLRFHLRFSL
jgi:hypothetical protein